MGTPAFAAAPAVPASLVIAATDPQAGLIRNLLAERLWNDADRLPAKYINRECGVCSRTLTNDESRAYAGLLQEDGMVTALTGPPRPADKAGRGLPRRKHQRREHDESRDPQLRAG